MNRKVVIPTELWGQLDLWNTLNGGRVEPQLHLHRGKRGFALDLKVPGLSPEALRIELSAGKIIIYKLVDVAGKDADQQVLPHVITQFPIPSGIDQDRIKARWAEDHWRVYLPFNETAMGKSRLIDIEIE
jgi:HSP20 family molecular chaperone IbpA